MDTSLTRPNLRQKSLTILCALLVALALLAGCASYPYVQPFDNKDYDLAIAKAKEVLNEKPQDSGAWYYIGRSYFEKDQYAEAENAFYKALPGANYYLKEDVLRQLARVHVKTGDYDRALEEYDKLLKDYPKAASDWTDRGFVCVYKGSYQEALQNFKKAIKLEKDKHRRNSRSPYYDGSRHEQKLASAYTGMAFAHLGLGQPEKALYMIDEAKRIYPGYDTRVDLALIYYASESEDRLKDHLNSTGLSISKTELDGYPVIAPLIEIINARKQAIQEAVKVENKGELRKAFRMYMKLLDKYPNDFDILSRIIELTKELDPPPATPEEVERYVSRGLTAITLAQAKSDYMNALEEFKKALQLAPWVPTVHYNMGLVAEQAELYEDAIQSFKFYLLAAPHASDGKQIKKKIYELEYTIDLRKKQMQDWLGTWVLEGMAELKQIVTEHRSDYVKGVKEIKEERFTGIDLKIASPPVDGKVTVEVRCAALMGKSWLWEGEVTPMKLTAVGPLKHISGEHDPYYGYDARHGKLEIIRNGDIRTMTYSADYYTWDHGVSYDTSHKYNGQVRKESKD
jgi:tetratricopeptide (TPR) repeat protein